MFVLNAARIPAWRPLAKGRHKPFPPASPAEVSRLSYLQYCPDYSSCFYGMSTPSSMHDSMYTTVVSTVLFIACLQPAVSAVEFSVASTVVVLTAFLRYLRVEVSTVASTVDSSVFRSSYSSVYSRFCRSTVSSICSSCVYSQQYLRLVVSTVGNSVFCSLQQKLVQ